MLNAGTRMRSRLLSAKREARMDEGRCPKCSRRLMAMTDAKGRTALRCLKCDKVDPIETDALKWASSPLAQKVSPG